ncbi:MAG: PBP1A family penicillin-binding protein [bacterium]
MLPYVVLYGTALALVWGFSISQDIIARFEGQRFRLPSRVYAEPPVLARGLEVTRFKILDRLVNAGYRRVDTTPVRSGQFHVQPDRVEIGVRALAYGDRKLPAYRVVLTLDDGRVTQVVAPDRKATPPYVLEPEVVSGLFERVWEERELVEVGKVPRALVNAIVATEDTRFLDHAGVDPIGIARALVANLRSGSVQEGGSTITQQLVKNLFLTPERTLSRKVREAAMALVLDALYDKDEILGVYLNAIYLGQRGAMGVYGVGEAARYYFGKPVEDLSLGECAMLGGLIRSPGRYDPFRHPDAARERRAVVLDRMVKTHRLSPEEAERAAREPLSQSYAPGPPEGAPYFVDLLRDELESTYSTNTLNAGGLRVMSTLDPILQHEAERAVAEGLAALEKRRDEHHPEGDPARLQAALIELDPDTGSIRSLVGGRDYRSAPYNRAVKSRRQPGSLFKPFLYACALAGQRDFHPTLASEVEDREITIRYDRQTWRPTNYDGEYRGVVPLHEALALSLNTPAVRIWQQVGTAALRKQLEAVGFGGKLPNVPSLALGAAEVTPLDVARAYGVLASGGLRTSPTTVRSVVDANGRVLTRTRPRATRVMDPEIAYLVTWTLEEVLQTGTGASARTLGLDRPAAGKTGTTDDFRDAWFAGYLPGRVVVVWVGRDNNQPVGMVGAKAALPIWVDYVTHTSWWPADELEAPRGISFAEIDPETGLLATAACPRTERLPFLEGTQPSRTCPLHPTLLDKVRGDDESAAGAGRGSRDAAPPNGSRSTSPKERDDSAWDWIKGIF